MANASKYKTPNLPSTARQTCRQLDTSFNSTAAAVTYLYLAFAVAFSQGIDEGPEGLKLISDLIREKLKIEISVLMGANIAKEVADEKFCETTIGNYCKGQFHLLSVAYPHLRQDSVCRQQWEAACNEIC